MIKRQDRKMLGANPGIEVRVRLAHGDRAVNASSADAGGPNRNPAHGTGGAARAAARRLRQRITEGMAALSMQG